MGCLQISLWEVGFVKIQQWSFSLNLSGVFNRNTSCWSELEKKLSSSSPMAQRRRTRRPRRTQYSRPPVQSSDPQSSMDHAADDNPSNTPAVELESVDISNNGFSTPKAQRFRIPEILTCPPAPKKRRPNYSLRRSPIAFFAPPDLELFFFFALGDVSVWSSTTGVFIEYIFIKYIYIYKDHWSFRHDDLYIMLSLSLLLSFCFFCSSIDHWSIVWELSGLRGRSC